MKKNQDALYSPMPAIVYSLFAASGVMFALFTGLYWKCHSGWLLTCAISLGTTFYHFTIRLLSPVILWFLFRRKYRYNSPWFREKDWEKPLYKALRVKRWKRYAPTFNPKQFSAKHFTTAQIISNMCHAEAVHELIVLLSLLSLLFAIPFGEFTVFLITGVLSALFDMSFVLIQRYNRPRVVRLMQKA